MWSFKRSVLGGYVDCRGFVGSIGVWFGYLCVSCV